MSKRPSKIGESTRLHFYQIENSLPYMIAEKGEEGAIEFLENLKNDHSCFLEGEDWGELIDATIVDVENGDYS